MNNLPYDLSDKGRSVWTADVDQPGFGNFCYGQRKVDSIDATTPTTSNVGASTQVNYHYSLVADAPAWATAAETQNAYPQIRADLAGLADQWHWCYADQYEQRLDRLRAPGP